MSNGTIDLTIPLFIVLLAALALYLYNKHRKTSAKPEQQPVAEEELPSATEEERKDRIKKKLPADFCDVIFGSKG